MLKSFVQTNYYPSLGLRPAEIAALQELPNRAKGRLFPTFALKPWLSSSEFSATLRQVELAYADRPWIADIDSNYVVPGGSLRPADIDFMRLQVPDQGFNNWVEFISNIPNAVPTLLVGPPDQMLAQLASLSELERGVVVRVPHYASGTLPALIAMCEDIGYEDVLFALDFQRIDGRYLAQVASAASLIGEIQDALPSATVSLVSSSFPSAFVGVTSQQVYERSFYDAVFVRAGDARLKYGDFGSVRIERGGGGGAPAPRVDYATFDTWKFFRRAVDDDYGDLTDPSEKAAARFECYREAAEILTDDTSWRPNLRIWGTQMIERTAAGDDTAIKSPVRSTAVRINLHLHLHLQSYFGDYGSAEDETDDDWVD